MNWRKVHEGFFLVVQGYQLLSWREANQTKDSTAVAQVMFVILKQHCVIYSDSERGEGNRYFLKDVNP